MCVCLCVGDRLCLFVKEKDIEVCICTCDSLTKKQGKIKNMTSTYVWSPKKVDNQNYRVWINLKYSGNQNTIHSNVPDHVINRTV